MTDGNTDNKDNLYDRALLLIAAVAELIAEKKNLRGRDIRNFHLMCEVVADWAELTDLYCYAQGGPNLDAVNRRITAKIFYALDFIAGIDMVAMVAGQTGLEIDDDGTQRIVYAIADALQAAAPYPGAPYRWRSSNQLEEMVAGRLAERPPPEPGETGIRSILLEPLILPVDPTDYGIAVSQTAEQKPDST